MVLLMIGLDACGSKAIGAPVALSARVAQ